MSGRDLRRDVAEYLRYLGEMGLEGLAVRPPAPAARRAAGPTPRSAVSPKRPVASRSAPSPTVAAPPRSVGLFDESPREPEGLGPEEALAWVRDAWLGDCRRCKLHEGRTNIVFGVGDPCARLMFVGEGPGRDEDLQGEPFVGRAGQLLTRIIEAMGLTRPEVYIANVIKCRPPENRNPEPDEVAACRGFLEAQIDRIRPRVLVLLGKVAAQVLLEVATPVGKLRGRFHDVRGIPAMVTWHPAYLLRNPAAKRDTWEDIKQVRERLARGG